MEKLEPIENLDHLIYGMVVHELEDGEVVERVDFSLICIDELKALKDDGVIDEFDDINKVNYPDSYSIMFTEWEKILGYQVAEESFDYVERLDLAATLLYEITFFGYEHEENEMVSKKEHEELERRIDEIEACYARGEEPQTISAEEFEKELLEMRYEFGEFNGKTEEEIEKNLEKEKIEREKDHEISIKLMLDDVRNRYEILKRLKKIYC
jgi:hypothetical protein